MEYPAPQLTRQNGLILCTEKCVDNLLTYERDELIREVLEQNDHEMDVMQLLKETTDDATIQPDES
jgi:hypothetical protein